jgi:hypothetical protein
VIVLEYVFPKVTTVLLVRRDPRVAT